MRRLTGFAFSCGLLAAAVFGSGGTAGAQTAADSTATSVEDSVKAATPPPAAAAPVVATTSASKPKPPLRDRIYFGGSVIVSFGDVTRIGVYPMIAYKFTPKLSLGAEVLGSTAAVQGQRYTSIDGAPTLRLRLGEQAFLDSGMLFNLSTSPGESLFDYALVAGFTVTR